MTKIIIDEISYDANVETVRGINGERKIMRSQPTNVTITYRTDDGSCYGELTITEDSLLEVKKKIVEIFGKGNTNIEEVLPFKKIE